MAIKQTLTLCLFSFLAIILTINGANVAATPPVDCTTTIMNMAGCLPFVEKGSKKATPDKECCPGFKQVAETDVECLCELFKQSESLGITLDYTRALSLPSVCNVKTPPFSQCNITLPGVSPPPAKSPPTVSPPVESPPTVPPAKSPPTASPPAKSPPTVSPPVESPPTVPPPSKSPPMASPPTKSPPTVAPAKSPVSPPVVSPPAKSPVTRVASPPATSPFTPTPVASPPATTPATSSPISPSPYAEPSMSSEDTVPPEEKSIAAQIKIHPFTTIVVLFSTILIYRYSF